MNAKRWSIFAGAAAVIAGGTVYLLGIYPPALSRDGQGTIGKRDVYRAEQPADASVTPGAAPVAAQAAGLNDKNFVLNNGQMSQLNSGQMVQLTPNQVTAAIASGQFAQATTGEIAALQKNEMFAAKNSGQAILSNGQMFQLNGKIFMMNNNQMFRVQNAMMFMKNIQANIQNGNAAAMMPNGLATN